MTGTHLDNQITFHTDAAGYSAEDFHPQSVEGTERLSTTYEFVVLLECSIDGGLSPDTIKDWLDKRAWVGFGPSGTQRVHGVLKDIELEDMEHAGERSIYRVTLVPRFWLAHFTRRSRAFNDMLVPDIIKEVLKDMHLVEGTDFDLVLQETYTKREYVAQYNESDFDFLSRWMERLGMFYFFEQTDSGEKLTIVDKNASLVAAPENGSCSYSAHTEIGAGALHRLRRRTQRIPKYIHLRESNWRSPSKALKGSYQIADTGMGLETHFGDHFKDDAEGDAYAKLRGEAWLAQQETYTAESTNHDFSPGHRVTLSGAPVGELDIEYVLTAVEHRASQGSAGAGSGSYQNRIEAIHYDTAFRAPRDTPWPRIDGVLPAKIDAATVNSAAPIDDKGRYRVVFPFDLYGKFANKASRWVRKAEPYSGAGHGMHFTLHVGAEVMIAHVNGDPDRPVIVGTTPNPAKGSPLLSDNATRSALLSRSGVLFDFQDDA